MDLLLLAVAAVLVNNFVLTQFLGLCPFFGVSRKVETAAGMAMATAFVLTLASILCHLAFDFILAPLDAEHLRTPAFILIIAVAVQLTEMAVRFTSPMLQQVLGLYLPLITTNCAVLGVALLNQRNAHDLVSATVYGASAAAGFGLVLVIFAALRERLESAEIPKPFRGAPIALISAGILAMGFMGFAGLAHATEREEPGKQELTSAVSPPLVAQVTQRDGPRRAL
jgi:electron transport complex protein RnfA